MRTTDLGVGGATCGHPYRPLDARLASRSWLRQWSARSRVVVLALVLVLGLSGALLTAGSAVAARLLQAWQSRQARIIASLTDAERAGLAIGLGGLLRGLVAEGILGDAGAEAPAGRTEPPASAADRVHAETPAAGRGLSAHAEAPPAGRGLSAHTEAPPAGRGLSAL